MALGGDVCVVDSNRSTLTWHLEVTCVVDSNRSTLKWPLDVTYVL